MLFLNFCPLGDEDSSPQMSLISRKWLGPLRSCSDQQDDSLALQENPPFLFGPSDPGTLAELREGAAEDKLHWKNWPPPPYMGRIAPFTGLLWDARGSGPQSEGVNQPFPGFSHPAGSTPFGAVAFGRVLSKTNEHLT